MSGVLLDTHAFLWFVFDDRRLSDRAARLLEEPELELLLSVASLWEIAIKVQIGKLGLGMGFEAFLDDLVLGAEVDVVAIEAAHLITYSRLPLLHRDPFDRLLVAQAQALRVPVVTSDKALAGYDVETIWD